MDTHKDKFSEYNRVTENEAEGFAAELNLLFASENSNNCECDCPASSILHVLPKYDLQHKLSHNFHGLNLDDNTENSFNFKGILFEALKVTEDVPMDVANTKDCAKHLKNLLYNECKPCSQKNTNMLASSIDSVNDNNILNRISISSIVGRKEFSPETTYENLVFPNLNSTIVLAKEYKYLVMESLPRQDIFTRSNYCYNWLVDSIVECLADKKYEIPPEISICNDLKHSKNICKNKSIFEQEEINLVVDKKTSKIIYVTVEKGRFRGLKQVCDSLGFEYVLKEISDFFIIWQCIKCQLYCTVELYQIGCAFNKKGEHNHAISIDSFKYAVLNKVNDSSTAVFSHSILNVSDYFRKSNLQPFETQLQFHLSKLLSAKKICNVNISVELGYFSDVSSIKSEVNSSCCLNNSFFGGNSLTTTLEQFDTLSLYVENFVTKIRYVSLKNGTRFANPKVYDSLGYEYSLGSPRKKHIGVVWRCCRGSNSKCCVTLKQSENNLEQEGEHSHPANLDLYIGALRSKFTEISPFIIPFSVGIQYPICKVLSNRKSSTNLKSLNEHLIYEWISSQKSSNLPLKESYAPNDILVLKPEEKCGILSKTYSNFENNMDKLCVNKTLKLSNTIFLRNQTRKSFEQESYSVNSVVTPADKYLFVENKISKVKYISLKNGILPTSKMPRVIDSFGYSYKTSRSNCNTNIKVKNRPAILWNCTKDGNPKCLATLKQTDGNFYRNGIHSHYGNLDAYFKALNRKIVENSPLIFSSSDIPYRNPIMRKSPRYCDRKQRPYHKEGIKASAGDFNVSNTKISKTRKFVFNKNEVTGKLVSKKSLCLKTGIAKEKSVEMQIFPHYVIRTNESSVSKLVDRIHGYTYKLLKVTEKVNIWVCSKSNSHSCKAAVKQYEYHFFKMRYEHLHRVSKRECSALNKKISSKLKRNPKNLFAERKKSSKVMKDDKSCKLFPTIQIAKKVKEDFQVEKNISSTAVSSKDIIKSDMPFKRNFKSENTSTSDIKDRPTTKFKIKNNNTCKKENRPMPIYNKTEDRSFTNWKRLSKPKLYCSLKTYEVNGLVENKLKEKSFGSSGHISIDSSLPSACMDITMKDIFLESKINSEKMSGNCKQLLLATNTCESEANILTETSASFEGFPDFSCKSYSSVFVREKKFNFSFEREKIVENIVTDVVSVGYPIRSSNTLKKTGGSQTVILFKLLKEGCKYFQDLEMAANICKVPSSSRVKEVISKNAFISQQFDDLVIMSYAAYSWTKLHWFYDSFEKSLKRNYKLDPCEYLDTNNSLRVFTCDVIKMTISENCRQSVLKNVFNVLCCINSLGQSINPLIIDNNHTIGEMGKMKELKSYYMADSNNGKLNKSIFHDWLLKFDSNLVIKEVPRPIILFIGDKNACVSYDSIKYAGNRNIVLYFLPPNSSHALNPLYISVFPKLKANFVKIANKVIKAEKFPHFFMKAYKNLNLFDLAQKGFKKAMLCPYDGNIMNRTKLKNGSLSKNGQIKLVLPHDFESNKENIFLNKLSVKNTIGMFPIKHVTCLDAESKVKDEINCTKYNLPANKSKTFAKNLLDMHGVVLEEEYLESEEIYSDVIQNFTGDFSTVHNNKILSALKKENLERKQAFSFIKEEEEDYGLPNKISLAPNLLECMDGDNEKINSNKIYSCSELQTLSSTSKIDGQIHIPNISHISCEQSVIENNFDLYNSAVTSASNVGINTCTLTSMGCKLELIADQCPDTENFQITVTRPQAQSFYQTDISSENKYYYLRPKKSSSILRRKSKEFIKTTVKSSVQYEDNLNIKNVQLKSVSKVFVVPLITSADDYAKKNGSRPLKRKRHLNSLEEKCEN